MAKQIPQGTPIPINLKEGKPLRCSKCRKDLFEPCHKLILIGPLAPSNPTGKEIMVPTPQMWRCISCKRLTKGDEKP